MLASLGHFPLSIFDGDMWCWDVWLDDFYTRIHSQTSLSTLLKFKLLLDFLAGKAKAAVSQLTLCDSNYEVALSLLQEQFGDLKKTSSSILAKLESLPQASNSAVNMRFVYNSIVARLCDLERFESVDNGATRRLVLAKLPDRIQCHLNRQKRKYADSEWTMKTMLALVNEKIKDEEADAELGMQNEARSRVYAVYTQRQPSPQRKFSRQQPSSFAPPQQRHSRTDARQTRPPFNKTKPRTIPCVYCGDSSHKAMDCSTVVDPERRLSILRSQHRCINCLSTAHLTQECTRSHCRRCNGKHHTSVCKQKPAFKQRTTVNAMTESPAETSAVLPSSGDQRLLCSHVSDAEGRTSLLIFQADVRSADSHLTKTATVFIDPGAEGSFICDRLRISLGLSSLYETHLQVDTFGSSQPLSFRSKVSSFKLVRGNKEVDVVAHSTPLLTAPLAQPLLSVTDTSLLSRARLPLAPRSEGSTVTPDILIGAD